MNHEARDPLPTREELAERALRFTLRSFGLPAWVEPGGASVRRVARQLELAGDEEQLRVVALLVGRDDPWPGGMAPRARAHLAHPGCPAGEGHGHDRLCDAITHAVNEARAVARERVARRVEDQGNPQKAAEVRSPAFDRPELAARADPAAAGREVAVSPEAFEDEWLPRLGRAGVSFPNGLAKGLKAQGNEVDRRALKRLLPQANRRSQTWIDADLARRILAVVEEAEAARGGSAGGDGQG